MNIPNDEQREEALKGTIYHKVEIGKKYRLFRKVTKNNFVLYKLAIFQKQRDGSEVNCYVTTWFKKGYEPNFDGNDSILIIIKKAYENYSFIQGDTMHRFTPSFTIIDYEVVKSADEIQNAAFNSFNKTYEDNLKEEDSTINTDFDNNL